MAERPSRPGLAPAALLFIESDGSIRSEPAGALGDRLGRWIPAPSPPGVLFLRREDLAESQRVVLCGEIQQRAGVLDLFSFVASAGWRGEIQLLDGSRRRSVFVEGGFVRGAASDDPSDRLGEILHRRGLVSAQHIQEAVKRIGKKRIGEVLVDIGACTRQDLFNFLTEQVREIVFGALLVRRGYFFFLDDFDAGQVPAHVHLSAQELLMEGVRRVDEMAYFRERIPNDQVVFTPRTPRPANPLDTNEEKVLALCDGARTLHVIARESALGEFETTKVAFHLLQAGFVDLGASLPRDEAAALGAYTGLVGSFNEILGEIQQAVDKAGRAEKTRDVLVQYLEGRGIADMALQGVRPDDGGRLDADTIVANLRKLPAGSRGEALSYALNEYVCFALFAAGSMLRREDEQRLLSRVNQLLREVHA